MAKRVQSFVMPLPEHARLVVPVMGPGTGGSGRSTVAGLLGLALGRAGPTVVLDTAARLVSPWPAWSAQPGAGLAAIPADRPVRRSEVLAAAAQFSSPSGGSWQVLTDHEDWAAAPLPLPSAPAAWYQLAAIGGWRAVVADTTHPVAHDIVSAQFTGAVSASAAWCAVPYAVPVLCAVATGSGVHAAQQAVQAAEVAGLPLGRMVLALVEAGDARPPAVVKAAATLLQPRVSALVTIPYDPSLRAAGLRHPERLKARTVQAADALAQAVVAAAQAAWGSPLGPADQPAQLPLARATAPPQFDHITEVPA